ncbi:MAG: glycosyltransferase family 4 protein [Candidatus Micrarchaeia archaeon]
MRICMIVEDYPQNGGGGGIFVQELSKELIKNNEIVVISRGKKDRQQKEGKITIMRFAGSRVIFLLKAVNYLIKLKPFDIYHAHGVFCGLIAKKVQMFKKKPIILHVHGFRNEEITGFVKYNIQNGLIKLDYDRIISVDEESRKKMIELGIPKNRITTIPCGINTSKFKPPKKKKNNKNKTFLFVGRLEKVKNIGLLLEAFKELKCEGLEPVLWIVGTGSLEWKLKNYCKKNKLDKVKFFGEILHEKLPVVYQKADFFVLPSKSEGMPLSLLEGIACGLPLIVSDIPNLREIINKSKSGLTFKNGDLEDLKEKIKKLISANKKEIDKLKKNGRKYVENNFSWENTEEKIDGIYDRIITDFLSSNHKE